MATSSVTLELNRGFWNRATGEVTILFGIAGDRSSESAIAIVPAAYRPKINTTGMCYIAVGGGVTTLGACKIEASTGHIKHYLTNQTTVYIYGLFKYKL